MIITVQSWPRKKKVRPYLKTKLEQKGLGGGVTPVIECLPSKHRAPNSIPSTNDNNKNKNDSIELSDFLGHKPSCTHLLVK
jgi:hypothetical protein